jgi:hypothetical protein
MMNIQSISTISSQTETVPFLPAHESNAAAHCEDVGAIHSTIPDSEKEPSLKEGINPVSSINAANTNFVQEAHPASFLHTSFELLDGDTAAHFATPDEEILYLKTRVHELEKELDGVSNKGKLIAQELDLFRQRRVVFWSDRFRNAFDAWNLMNFNFQQLKDDSAIFHGNLHALRLQPSLSLLRVPFLSYNFRLSRGGLCGILLAPVLDVPLHLGELCVRIFSAPDTLLASCSKSVANMSDEEPVLFSFDPIPNSHEIDLTMRVYVQGVDAPVRIFELRRYALGGFGKLQSRPFAGYLFE